jgi:DAK2 domain fusion protein YloV
LDLVTEQVSIARGFQIENGVIVRCNGIGLKNMLHSGRRWLEAHADIVNSLNVYPVPDGDTGTNMVLTMRAALAQVDQASDHDVSTIAAAVAEGALMGARGNSGVILSQFLHGLAEGLQGRTTFTAADFARAAQLATAQAYQSVIEPVEGTILTIARAVSDTAQQSAQEHADLAAFFVDVLHAAKIAQADTPLLLPILKEAGVTDSGGQGLVYLLEGALRYLQGQPVDEAPADAEALVRATINVAGDAYGYDVQFLIRGSSLNVAAIRDHIDGIGWSALVVGDERLVKVHVHTKDPGVPLSYGAQQGIVSDVVVENLDEQAQAFAHRAEEVGQTTAVAVASGEGFARIFASLGVSQVVTGGQAHNPSVEDLLAAVNEISADNVVVLPNNSNVILAAQQAQKMAADKNVVVLPTHTVPQGIAAMLSFNQHLDLDTNVQRMAETAQQVQTIAVTRVTRDSKFNGFKMKMGNVIGLLDNELVSTGEDMDDVSLDVLAGMDIDLYEISTIYFGQDSLLTQAQALAGKITARYPHLDVDVHEGGQPHYHYIISME